MEKNSNLHYVLTSHVAERGSDGQYYCRALQTVMVGAYCYCTSCPLFGGFSQFGNMEEEPECWYYDMEEMQEEKRLPEEQEMRTAGLILAGFTGEFPDYLPQDETARPFSVIERAIQYAAEAHKGAVRKGSLVPYIAHPMETMMLVASMTNDNEVIAAAALHDVVEDTPITIEEIEAEFGQKIAFYVAHESENKREDRPKSETWKIRKQEQLEKTKDASRSVKCIMLADKLSNMRASLRDFKRDGRAIWQKFNMKDEKEQYWYYHAVADVVKDLADTPCYQEYIRILDIVFHDLDEEMTRDL